MKLNVSIENVQHIVRADLDIDLARAGLTCLVGRNGVGKTTLVKALRNLKVSDTFKKTSIDWIFNEQSRITYKCWDNTEYLFLFDKNLRAINCRTPIKQELRDELDVELPMPFGDRFHYFQSISEADGEIRRSVVLETYSKPDELIDFLHGIYGAGKFDRLRQIEVKGKLYYFLVLDDDRYIREDYFSSGEYFLICLYRNIRARRKLIVIDEIDISLDAAAQVNLVGRLRDFCRQYKVNIVFTTHSMVMMRMVEPDELFYVESDSGAIEINNRSYTYIKSRLFGFSGWDRYLLVEDEMLVWFIEYLLEKYKIIAFYNYKILYIASGEQTVDLMNRNVSEGFLTDATGVVSVIDGDQRGENYVPHAKGRIIFLPWPSIEKQILAEYSDGIFPRLERKHGGLEKESGKPLYKALMREGKISRTDIFDHLCNRYSQEVEKFVGELSEVLAK